MAVEWQPIETAPRDGTQILGFGIWAGEINGPGDYASRCVIEWRGGITHYPGYEWLVSHTEAYAEWFRPTHWMPLPPPPPDASDGR